MVKSAAYKNAIRRLWIGSATISNLVGEVNEKNGRTEQAPCIVAADVPCRISFDSIKSTDLQNEAALVAQTVTLFIDPSVEIPEGSMITVTQNNVTRNYKRSGKSAVYTYHQEVPLELCEEWA